MTQYECARSVAKRELQSLTLERDRQNTVMRALQNDVHSLQLTLGDIKAKLHDKSALEQRIAEWKAEIAESANILKVIVGLLYSVIAALTQYHAGLGCQDC